MAILSPSGINAGALQQLDIEELEEAPNEIVIGSEAPQDDSTDSKKADPADLPELIEEDEEDSADDGSDDSTDIPDPSITITSQEDEKASKK